MVVFSSDIFCDRERVVDTSVTDVGTVREMAALCVLLSGTTADSCTMDVVTVRELPALRVLVSGTIPDTCTMDVAAVRELPSFRILLFLKVAVVFSEAELVVVSFFLSLFSACFFCADPISNCFIRFSSVSGVCKTISGGVWNCGFFLATRSFDGGFGVQNSLNSSARRLFLGYGVILPVKGSSSQSSNSFGITGGTNFPAGVLHVLCDGCGFSRRMTGFGLALTAKKKRLLVRPFSYPRVYTHNVYEIDRNLLFLAFLNSLVPANDHACSSHSHSSAGFFTYFMYCAASRL